MGHEQHEYNDIYTRYERGLNKLLAMLGKKHPRYNDALSYEQQLRENIDKARLYGDSSTKDERNAIINRLNRFALETLDVSFNELCRDQPVLDRDEDPVVAWLKSMGFRDNPFDTSSAAEEDGDYLSSFFLKVPFFYRLIGNPKNPRSVILFAVRGQGKTACRLEVARIARENTTAPVLPVHLIEFGSLADMLLQQGPPLVLSSFIPLIVRRTLEELTIELKREKTRKERLEADREMVARFCALKNLYAEPERCMFTLPPASTYDQERYYQQTPLSMHDYLKTLALLVQHSGFASVYVLIDGVDELPQTNNDPALALELVRPLLESPGSFEGTGVGLKFFLPDTLETLMRQRNIGRLDRIRPYHLKWKDDDLRTMWRQRLASYSRVSETANAKGAVNSFSDLCEGEDDVDSMLIEKAQGSPRTLVAIGREIVETHCYENNPSERDLIPMATVHEVLERGLFFV